MRRRDRERSSIIWLTPQMAPMAGDDVIRSQQPPVDLPCGYRVQRPSPLYIAFQVTSRKLELKVEQWDLNQFLDGMLAVQTKDSLVHIVLAPRTFKVT